jgi:hypothetical protein
MQQAPNWRSWANKSGGGIGVCIGDERNLWILDSLAGNLKVGSEGAPESRSVPKDESGRNFERLLGIQSARC